MADSRAKNPDTDGSDTSEALILYTRGAGCAATTEPVEKSTRSRAWIGELLISLTKTSVAFFLGYLLIQSVELDLKRAQFSADAADKLKTFVIELNSQEFENDPERSKATALALGGFGGVAAFPLVQFIEHGNEFQIGWGMLGLEQAGLIANDATCDVIVRVIDDPTETFRWQTRKAVTEVAGAVACPDAVGPLERLDADLKNTAVPINAQPGFKEVIQTTLTQIERANQRARPWWSLW